jgi:hypothetical protein|tara:strand:- start:90 stop:266 length:177 start_codon:yes stop_codon:yes gene_type:complete
MSYTHTHLPHIEDLKESIESNPDVLRYYAKYSGLVGSSESMDYLDKKLKEYYDSKRNK